MESVKKYMEQYEELLENEVQEKRESLESIQEKLETATGGHRSALEKAKMHILGDIGNLIQKISKLETQKEKLKKEAETQVEQLLASNTKALEAKARDTEAKVKLAEIEAKKVEKKIEAQKRHDDTIIKAAEIKLEIQKKRLEDEQSQSRIFIKHLKGIINCRLTGEAPAIFAEAGEKTKQEMEGLENNDSL